MKTIFHYKKQEAYTQEEVNTLLSQAETAIQKEARDGYVSQEEFNSLKELSDKDNKALSEFRNKEVSSVKENIGKEILGDNYNLASKYVSFSDDFDFKDIEAIKEKYNEVKQDLFATTANDPFDDGTKEIVANEFTQNTEDIEIPAGVK